MSSVKHPIRIPSSVETICEASFMMMKEITSLEFLDGEDYGASNLTDM